MNPRHILNPRRRRVAILPKRLPRKPVPDVFLERETPRKVMPAGEPIRFEVDEPFDGDPFGEFTATPAQAVTTVASNRAPSKSVAATPTAITVPKKTTGTTASVPGTMATVGTASPVPAVTEKPSGTAVTTTPTSAVTASPNANKSASAPAAVKTTTDSWGPSVAKVFPFDDVNKPPAGSVGLLPRYQKRLAQRREQATKGGVVGITTGLAALDRLLQGHRGVTLLGGLSAVGKSSFGLQSVVAALLADEALGALIFAYEYGSRDEVLDQLYCMLAGVDLAVYEKGLFTPEMAQRLKAAEALLTQKLLPRLVIETLDDQPREESGWFDFRKYYCRSANRLIEDRGAKRIITLVDRFQRMPYPVLCGGTPPIMVDLIRAAQAAPDAWRMQEIRQQYRDSISGDGIGWPFLVVTEVRKQGDANRELELEDVLGTIGNVYDADRVILLQRGKGPGSDAVTPTILKTSKARRGAEARLDLSFRFKQFRFEEFEMPGAPTAALDSVSTDNAKPVAKGAAQRRFGGR